METKPNNRRSTVHSITPPSAELQAEFIAALHQYIGRYKKLIVPVLSASKKELKVTGITRTGADSTFISVRFDVKIREILAGAVLYTLDGSAHGKFQLGQVTADEICIAAQLGSYTALTITSLDVPRLSGPDEYDAAKRAIAANFPPNLCVPLYPSITMDNVSVEECFQPPAKPGPLPNTARFTVAIQLECAYGCHALRHRRRLRTGRYRLHKCFGFPIHPQPFAEGDH